MIQLLISLKGVLAFLVQGVVVIVVIVVVAFLLKLVELFFKGRL